jgi:uncharacterized cupredoxin-like copper-binding protein
MARHDAAIRLLSRRRGGEEDNNMKMFRHGLPILVLVVALGLLVTGCGPASSASGHGGGFSDAPAAQTIEVYADRAGRLAWERAAYEATAGDVAFVVSTPAGLAHNFGVEGPGVAAHSEPFPGGATRRFTLTGLQPGVYRLVCTVPGHREAGMVATLTVR